MESPLSQEMRTLNEELGFQRAVLASLEGAQDADSKRARINARREISLVVERLRALKGSPSSSAQSPTGSQKVKPEPRSHPSSQTPATPTNLPNRKRDFQHRGSPTTPDLHPKSQKTTPMSAATSRARRSSLDDLLDSDNLEVIDLTGDDADGAGYIAAQLQQEKLAAQRQRDQQMARRLQQQRASQQQQPQSGTKDPRSDPLQRLMLTARTNGAPSSGFRNDDSVLRVEYPGAEDRVNIPGQFGAGSEEIAMRQRAKADLIRSIQQAEHARQMAALSHQRARGRHAQLPGGMPYPGGPPYPGGMPHPGGPPYPGGMPHPGGMPQHPPLPGAFPGTDFSWASHQSSSSSQPRHVLGSTTWANARGIGAGSTMNDIINRTSAFSYGSAADGFGMPPVSDRMRHFLDLTGDDQEKMTEKELEELLSNIRPDEEIPLAERQEKVEGLKVNIYHHQQLALKWMQNMEEGTNKGGILADDMGLGKTISALALMITRPATARPKTNLIIGPLSLIRQWEEEIRTKVASSHRLSVFVYHNKRTTTDELLSYDVVLTTYGTIAAEVKRLDAFTKENIDAGRSVDYNHSQTAAKFPLLHPTKAKYHRVILDEAQCIKNKETQTAKACHRLRADYRWCLTGTPMMNGVLELYSLLAFLHIKPYCVWERFREQFGVLFGKKGDSKMAAMTTLRALLKALMLRRKKNSLLDGKPIVNLPVKTEKVVYAELSPDERDYYNQLELKAQVQFSKYLREGSVGKNYSNILVLLLRLRQACCHPHLNLDVSDATPITQEDVLDLVKELKPSIVNRIKGSEAFECPICYDAVPSPQFFIPCGHDSCSQCLSRLIDNAQTTNIHEGNESDKCKCPVCRGQFDPKLCFTLEAFKKVHMPETLKEESVDESEDESGESDDEDVKAVEETDASDNEIYADDVDEKGNLRGFIDDDNIFDSDVETDKRPDLNTIKREVSSTGSGLYSQGQEEKEKLRKAKIRQGKQARPAQAKKTKKNKHKNKKDAKDAKDKIIKTDIKPSMLKELRVEARKSREAYRKYMEYLRQNWLPAAKVTECMRLLKEAEEQGRKSIVFSQWTLLLDLIEIGMEHDNFVNKPKRYDGGMSGEERNTVAKAFQEPKRRDVTVMLVSLRAGNAGLNLTQATRVIIMDPFWNPYIEMQAVDRAYRIGQKEEVEVFRILTQETIEDRIVELKDKKQAIVEAALDETEAAKIGRLGVSELKFLFNRRD